MNLSFFRALYSVAVSGLMLVAAGSYAQVLAAPILNRDYVRIAPPLPPAGGDVVEVVEFVYYGCPVCYELEPMLSRWSDNLPAGVSVRRVPALATANWENFARLYYTLELIGEVQRLNWPVYEGIHFEEVSLNLEPVMLKWVSGKGVDMEKFLQIYRSPEVEEKLAEARELIRRYSVKGVPSIAVDRKFLTSARMAGGTRQLMPLVDRLIDLARKERAK